MQSKSLSASTNDPTRGVDIGAEIEQLLKRRTVVAVRAKAFLRMSPPLETPTTGVLMRDLAEQVRDAKRRRLRAASFSALEHSLDKIILPEFGHLRPCQVGPDQIAHLIRDLEARGLRPASIRRYLSPLGPIFKLALRRNLVHANPLALLSDEELPTGGVFREHYVWSADEIASLFAAADTLGARPQARYNYAALIRLLALTGLRVSEALALRWSDIRISGELHVRASIGRDGTLNAPKTPAGRRIVPLSDALVDVFVNLKADDPNDEHFVFATTKDGRPISYWNFRRRGFVPALKAAGLANRGITVHSLRSAAASMLISQGLTPVEVATVLGHRDANVTLKVYARLFDKDNLAARVRAAQVAMMS